MLGNEPYLCTQFTNTGLGNGPHMLGIGPPVLGKGPHLCTQFKNRVINIMGWLGWVLCLSWPLLGEVLGCMC